MSNRIAGSIIAALLLCIGAMTYVELSVLHEYSRVASEYQIAASVRDRTATVAIDEVDAASESVEEELLPASVDGKRPTDEVACLKSNEEAAEGMEIDS